MSIISIISTLNRLTLQSIIKNTVPNRNIAITLAKEFRASPVLLAEPLKKKKRLDPAIIRAREERRKKKIEKQIRRLEKNARQLKPIEECEVPLYILDERNKRKRNLSSLPLEILEKRATLEKKWCSYKRQLYLQDMQMLDRISFAQQKALDELRKESEQLYNEAIQPNFYLVPFTSHGPVDTPPLESYNVPDGEYLDISKKW